MLLLIWLLVLFFKYRKNRTRFFVTGGTLPPINRSAWNHLMILGSDEEFMLFLPISRSEFKFLLDSFILFGGDEGSASFPPSGQECSALLLRSSWNHRPSLWFMTCQSQEWSMMSQSKICWTCDWLPASRLVGSLELPHLLSSVMKHKKRESRAPNLLSSSVVVEQAAHEYCCDTQTCFPFPAF